MALVTPSVTVDQKEGICMEVSGRGQQFYIDQPVESGGTNKGFSPVEALLGCLGACMNMMTLYLAGQRQIPIAHIQVQAEGDLDPAGPVRPGFQNIRLHFTIQSTAPQDQLEALLAEAAAHCPVGDTLRNGTQLVVNGVDVRA